MSVIKSVINVIYCIGFSNLYIELTFQTVSSRYGKRSYRITQVGTYGLLEDL